jgi:UDP-galactopyranose mutase
MNTTQTGSTKTPGKVPLYPSRNQKTQRSYEQYLARAHDEERAGNRIEAENYYQHAEHYFRSIR